MAVRFNSAFKGLSRCLPPSDLRMGNSQTVYLVFNTIRIWINLNNLVINLTFIGPCIAKIFADYNRQDATFHTLIISVRRSTCFRRFFPSIIRSLKLHIQCQVFVRPILLPAASLTGIKLVPSQPH